MTNELKIQLEQPEILQQLTTEFAAFNAALAENPDILRFRYYRPKKLQDQLSDLKREPIIFHAAEDYNPKRRFFISTDEIDSIIRGGRRSTDYRRGSTLYIAVSRMPKHWKST